MDPCANESLNVIQGYPPIPPIHWFTRYANELIHECVLFTPGNLYVFTVGVRYIAIHSLANYQVSEDVILSIRQTQRPQSVRFSLLWLFISQIVLHFIGMKMEKFLLVFIAMETGDTSIQFTFEYEISGPKDFRESNR